MKSIPLLIATLAIPSSVALAQTPPTTGGSSSMPYIPLFGSTGGTGGGSSTWFIDVAKNQVVQCSLPSGGTPEGSPTQSFTCTAQPVPAAAPTSPGATPPTPATPATPATPPAGGAGAPGAMPTS
jgi:hypothetical protein